jgi:hypothetical protein
LAHQFLDRRLKRDRGFCHDLALHGHRRWDAQVLFQVFQPIPGKPAPDRSTAIMLAADSSYLFSPAPSELRP